MVSIFTYRDERKLFAVVATVIVAAVVAFLQIDAAKNGKPSFLAIAVTSASLYLQSALSALGNALHEAGVGVAAAPHLYADDALLRQRNRELRQQNARLREVLSSAPEAAALERTAALEPGGIEAAVIGYDPENVSRSIALDRGSQAGIERDDGVLSADGVVGRVVAVTPFESTVLLLTDGGSKVPAIVQRGRWWGIATGTNARVRLQFVSQDAKLKVGDAVVTGAGRSFAAGLPIGRIVAIDHPEGGLYQSALLEPAVPFGRLSRVLVVKR